MRLKQSCFNVLFEFYFIMCDQLKDGTSILGNRVYTTPLQLFSSKQSITTTTILYSRQPLVTHTFQAASHYPCLQFYNSINVTVPSHKPILLTDNIGSCSRTITLTHSFIVVLLCNRTFFGQKSCKIREFC